MKKILMMAILCLVFTTSGFAQFKRTAFNHVGLNAGVGTEGISIGVAAPISNFVELEAGVDILPKMLKISEQMNIEADASIIVQGQSVRIPDSPVDVVLISPVQPFMPRRISILSAATASSSWLPASLWAALSLPS